MYDLSYVAPLPASIGGQRHHLFVMMDHTKFPSSTFRRHGERRKAHWRISGDGHLTLAADWKVSVDFLFGDNSFRIISYKLSLNVLQPLVQCVLSLIIKQNQLGNSCFHNSLDAFSCLSHD